MRTPAWSIHTIGGHALGGESDAEWAAKLVDDLPIKWAGHLMRRWRAEPVRQRRNLGLLTGCKALGAANMAGISPDAKDSTIRQEAEQSARDMTRRLGWVHRTAVARLADREPEQRDRLDMLGQCIEAQHWLASRGLVDHWPAGKTVTVRGALKRVQDAAWWRRVLRRVHAVAVEGTARAIGLVHKRAGCYASDDACERRRGQVARNAASLENVAAINERGQQYTLAELAAKGPANREIRRHELMTRIAGFELIAKDCGHAAAFVTVTCPSRMHAMRQRRGGGVGGVEENPAHDGTKPDAAQRYLAHQWARFRSAADRRGLEVYGFRIAEPNHDGTPHWHAILFHPAKMTRGKWEGMDASAELSSLLHRYFLANDSSDERGASQHRVTIKPIDWTRGSAAGYVAKYVAKNVDGMHVERDLYGNDAITSSQRVEAWATTWRIRQFQQIGGAPVTIWRELRRLHTDQAAAAPAIALMLEAVNTSSQAEQHNHELMQRHTAAHGWASYLGVQGGHRVKRKDLRVKLLRDEPTGELGKYGEPLEARIVGVSTMDARSEWVDMLQHPRGGFRRTFETRVEVESERSTWIVVPKAFAAAVIERMHGAQEASRSGAAVAPWSAVNNCPRAAPAPAAFEGARLFAAPVERHRKLGRWNDWSEKHHGNDDERDPGR